MIKTTTYKFFGCGISKVENKIHILKVMDELLSILKVERKGEPYFKEFDADHIDFYQPVHGSFIAARFNVDKGSAVISMFSKEDYDEDEVCAFLTEAFDAIEVAYDLTLRKTYDNRSQYWE